MCKIKKAYPRQVKEASILQRLRLMLKAFVKVYIPDGDWTVEMACCLFFTSRGIGKGAAVLVSKMEGATGP